MSQLHAHDIFWLERNIIVAANLPNAASANNRNIFNLASIAKCDGDDLIIHAGLGLRA